VLPAELSGLRVSEYRYKGLLTPYS